MRSYIHFAAPLALGALLAACGGQEREASAEANGATAEVSTPLPESQVSDTQLQNAAEGAAAAAATPQAGASVVVTAPEGDPATTATPNP